MSDPVYWQVQLFDMNDPQFFADWTLLSNSYHGNNQLLGTEFLTSLLVYFGHTPLYQVRAIRQGQVQCLMLLRQRNKLIWELYKPSQAQVGLLLINPAFTPDVTALLSALPGIAARIDFLSLDPAEHLALLNVLHDHQQAFYATNMQIKLQDGFDSYWQLRSKNLRKNMSRYENRLQRENTTLDFRQISSAQHIKSAVDRYGMIESKGWKGKLGTALHPSNRQGQFYRDFLYQLAQQNNAVVYEYYIQDRLVASRLCCIKHDMLIILKTTFDEEFKSFALGRLLLKQILHTLFDNHSVKVIDFYTNASPEQLEWATDTRSIYNGTVYAKNIFGNTLQLLTRLKQKLKKKPVTEVAEP
ncbi:CelD/BcsL family acetyltransferase involved in cellulose biosynthesis [Rheinheimera pacifica]|uniref:GNAT family N-acetyltransferase n=1 Tax=Rheinheimera pacifica TaxID=173990 RepID=UPI0028634CC6|nr:GNAT family N-acetyltransferase [Rheinheimera pacifica]MDR6983605.1 CelD/BcsL family acetyltransferase involved in cellulose biosynthesis [Rheinheimera pacifica]